MNASAIMCGIVIGGSFACSAMAHLGDIGLKAVAGKIYTGEVVDLGFGQMVEPGTRVFGADMGEISVGFSDEPGYFAANDSFAQGTAMGFNIRKALRSWNGSDFGSIATQTLLIEDAAAVNSRVTPATDVSVSGFVFQNVDSSGGFDEHLNFTLSDVNAVGVYLLELETTGTGLGTSDAYWIVFNNGASEAEHDAAIEWTNTNLVPVPGLACLPLAACVMTQRRRRS